MLNSNLILNFAVIAVTTKKLQECGSFQKWDPIVCWNVFALVFVADDHVGYLLQNSCRDACVVSPLTYTSRLFADPTSAGGEVNRSAWVEYASTALASSKR